MKISTRLLLVILVAIFLMLLAGLASAEHGRSGSRSRGYDRGGHSSGGFSLSLGHGGFSIGHSYGPSYAPYPYSYGIRCPAPYYQSNSYYGSSGYGYGDSYYELQRRADEQAYQMQRYADQQSYELQRRADQQSYELQRQSNARSAEMRLRVDRETQEAHDRADYEAELARAQSDREAQQRADQEARRQVDARKYEQRRQPAPARARVEAPRQHHHESPVPPVKKSIPPVPLSKLAGPEPVSIGREMPIKPGTYRTPSGVVFKIEVKKAK